MRRQMKRPTSNQEPKKPGEKLALAEKESQLAPYMEQDEAELEEVDDDDDEDMAGGHAAQSSTSCGLGEKKRRLAMEQVRALERSFDVDNKLDPDRKTRIARDLGLQPRQVAVWFQNRRARWKTKQLERDFSALRARHDALRVDCDALRRDKDALAAEIRELREKLSSKPDTAGAVKVEAGSDATAEERQATVHGAAAVYKDGSSDSDSSAVFNDDASPYSGAVFETQQEQQQDLMGFGASFLDTSTAAPTMGCSTLPALETKWQHGPSSYDSYKGGGYGFTEEWLAGSGVLGSDSAGFFSEEHAASNLNFGWCSGSATDGWDLGVRF